MKPFFKEEIEDTVSKINKLKTNSSLCFNLIADSHIYSYTKPDPCGQPINSFENVGEVNKRADIDCIFHLGDIIWGMKNYWTNEVTYDFLSETRDLLGSFNKKAYFVSGNHDGPDGKPPIQEQWYDIFVKPKLNELSNYKEGKPYYSVDFEALKVRVICLMSSHQEQGGEIRPYGWYKEQMDWLTDTLLSTPNDYKIILMSHINPIDGDKGAKNCEEFIGYLNAFQNKTVFESAAFCGDFTNKSTAKIVVLFSAHTHYDRVVPQNVLPFPVIERACNRLHEINPGDGWSPKDGGTSPKRAPGTVSEDLWDTVIYKPDEGTMDFIRFGAGDDLHIKL